MFVRRTGPNRRLEICGSPFSKTREFCSILHFDFDVQSASEFNGFQPNSYATEQGIFKRVSGNFFRGNREISPLRPATAQRGLSTVGVGVGISRNSSTLKPTDASVTIR